MYIPDASRLGPVQKKATCLPSGEKATLYSIPGSEVSATGCASLGQNFESSITSAPALCASAAERSLKLEIQGKLNPSRPCAGDRLPKASNGCCTDTEDRIDLRHVSTIQQLGRANCGADLGGDDALGDGRLQLFDPRSDIFSFGARLYEMFTAKRAFLAASRAERHKNTPGTLKL